MRATCYGGKGLQELGTCCFGWHLKEALSLYPVRVLGATLMNFGGEHLQSLMHNVVPTQVPVSHIRSGSSAL